MLKENDLTFVIQGAISTHENNTQNLINDINQHFPESTIIVSTWKLSGELLTGYDTLIETDDPGGYINGNTYLNVNRQILSSLRGIELVKTKYCIKIRSDMRVNNNSLIDEYNKLVSNYEHERVDNDSWVAVINLTSVNVDRYTKPLAICDWVYLGLTKDVIKYFQIEFYPEEYFLYKKQYSSQKNEAPTLQKYNAEQWIIYRRYFKKLRQEEISFEGTFDSNPKLLRFHKEILAKENAIFTMKMLGLGNSKYKVYNFGMSRMMTRHEWEINYNHIRNYNYNKGKLKVDIDRLFYNIISFRFPRLFINIAKRLLN